MGDYMHYESPWEWDMDINDLERTGHPEDDTKIHDEEDEILIMTLVKLALEMYLTPKTKPYQLRRYLQKFEKKLESLNKNDLEEQGISSKVLCHVVNITKLHVFQELGYTDRADAETENFELLIETNDYEVATLSALKSIAFASYFGWGKSKAIGLLLENATNLNEKCAVFHWLRATNLRKCRIHAPLKDTTSNQPGKEEITGFLKAFEYSKKNPKFGLDLAKCYRERCRKWREIYDQVLAMKPKSNSIRCRLAEGFMLMRNAEAVEECLDYVEANMPESPMFLFHKARYLMSQGNNKVAIALLAKAKKANHFLAALDFVRCLERISPSRNYSKYFIYMILNSQDRPDRQQLLYFHFATYSYLKRKKILNSLELYKEGISLADNLHTMKNYRYIIDSHKHRKDKRKLGKVWKTIYDFLRYDFLERLKTIVYSMDQRQYGYYRKLRSACEASQH